MDFGRLMRDDWKAAIPPLELTAALDDMALDGSTLVPISQPTSTQQIHQVSQEPAIPDWSEDEDEDDNRAPDSMETTKDSADHEAFMQKRNMHYNMRAALEARYDDDEEEEEEGRR